MSILDEQARLNPKGAEIQLRVELLVDCPDHDPLLNKLETEHKVIIILQRPDEKGYGDPDHGMFEMEQPKNYKRYMSYFVTLSPTFDEFYKAEYLKQRSTTSTLTDNNRALVIEVMRAIDDELSISGKTQVSIDPVQSEGLCNKALVFLKKIGAIKDYEAIDEIGFNGEYERMMPTGQIDIFKVEVILPDFDELLTEIANDQPTPYSHKGKVIIDKESKPKPDYPDDTISIREEGPTKSDILKDLPPEPENQSNKVVFNVGTGTLILGSKTCDIPDETLEYYICRFTFKNRQVAAKEDDILEKSVKSQDSQRAVYDAMLRVNKKVKDTLGLEKLLVYKAAKLRINKKYQ